MEDWKEYRLGDVVESIKERIDTITLNTMSYISTENMLPNKGGVVSSSGIPLGKAIKFKEDDVLISNIRPYFRKIWKADKIGGCSSDVICLRATNKVEPLFLYYLLCQDLFFDYMMQGAKGTKMPRGDRNQIMQWTISLPSLEKQKDIVSILSSLDDKIECNRKINENLEAQAQALFKSWFVDFEPFRDGPFVESELGPIPQGWRVGCYDDIIISTVAGDWGKEKPEGNYTHKVACVRGCDFQDIKNGLKGKTPERFILEKNYQNKHFIDNDILVEISGGTATVSTGRVCPVSKMLIDSFNGDIVCTNFCRVIRPTCDFGAFLYYSWLNKYNNSIMFAYENGTSGIKNFRLNEFITKEPVIIPPESLASDFQRLVDKIHHQIQVRGIESRRLGELRDALLPRLMSGELKVSDVKL